MDIGVYDATISLKKSPEQKLLGEVYKQRKSSQNQPSLLCVVRAMRKVSCLFLGLALSGAVALALFTQLECRCVLFFCYSNQLDILYRLCTILIFIRTIVVSSHGPEFAWLSPTRPDGRGLYILAVVCDDIGLYEGVKTAQNVSYY